MADGTGGVLLAQIVLRGDARTDSRAPRYGVSDEPDVLISVSVSALEGRFDGTAPGHGWKNAPDMLFDSAYATCDEQAAAVGGGEE